MVFLFCNHRLPIRRKYYYSKYRERQITILIHISYDGDFLWKAEFTYEHKNQSSDE